MDTTFALQRHVTTVSADLFLAEIRAEFCAHHKPLETAAPEFAADPPPEPDMLQLRDPWKGATFPRHHLGHYDGMNAWDGYRPELLSSQFGTKLCPSRRPVWFGVVDPPFTPSLCRGMP